MRKFELFAGSAAWMGISFIMLFAALEPVELRARQLAMAQSVSGACLDAAASPTILCETSSL
jgi:hypothetical protein